MSWDSDEPWFGEGLRFECQCCGACCVTHGEYAYVYLTKEDLQEASSHLKISSQEFVDRYCVRLAGELVFRYDEEDCPMLTEQRKCRIYPVRPVQCRTWPFWPENLTRIGWSKSVRSFCPGAGVGPVVDRYEIQRLAKEMEKAQARR